MLITIANSESVNSLHLENTIPLTYEWELDKLQNYCNMYQIYCTASITSIEEKITTLKPDNYVAECSKFLNI